MLNVKKRKQKGKNEQKCRKEENDKMLPFLI